MIFVNRLESYRGLKDVKIIIYRIVWKYKHTSLFKELFERLTWEDDDSFWVVNRKLYDNGVLNYRTLNRGRVAFFNSYIYKFYRFWN